MSICRIAGESFSVVCGSIVIVANAIVDTLHDRRSEQNMTKEVILRHGRQKCRSDDRSAVVVAEQLVFSAHSYVIELHLSCYFGKAQAR